MLDDVIVVVKSQGRDIDRFVEGPGVRSMFPGQHLSHHACTEPHLLLALRRKSPSGFQTASQVMLRIWLQHLSFGLLGSASGLSLRLSLGRDGRRFAELIVGRRSGGVCFSLLALPWLLEIPRENRKTLALYGERCSVLLTLMRAGELCSIAPGWRPRCIGAEGETDVMPWARTSGVESGYGGPK